VHVKAASSGEGQYAHQVAERSPFPLYPRWQGYAEEAEVHLRQYYEGSPLYKYATADPADFSDDFTSLPGDMNPLDPGKAFPSKPLFLPSAGCHDLVCVVPV
jgi:hypothetical protein